MELVDIAKVEQDCSLPIQQVAQRQDKVDSLDGHHAGSSPARWAMEADERKRGMMTTTQIVNVLANPMGEVHPDYAVQAARAYISRRYQRLKREGMGIIEAADIARAEWLDQCIAEIRREEAKP